MDKARILVVDDEADLVELVSYNLKKEGFDVDSAFDGEEALAKLRKVNYALLILDLMLPGIQGMELCRILRNNPATAHLPVIMLTAKGEELDKIIGLEMGADDYITKPFSTRELVARARAVLRRYQEKPAAVTMLKLGGLEIDRDKYAVFIEGRQVKLSAIEFKLLLYLAERKGRVFSREQLLDGVWKDESFVEPRTVDVHVRRLRSKIEKYPTSPRYIKTMRSIGYFFDSGQ